MKIRHGFVSNSSSSSFVISKAALSRMQLLMIVNHIQTAKFLSDLGVAIGDFDLEVDPGDQWSISEDGDDISGETCMDNFDMKWLLEQIGVPAHAITWGTMY